MNQRIKRAQERNDSTFQTGGHVVHHNRGTDPVVRIPQKATGDVSDERVGGMAKASPLFKKIEPVPQPKTKAEEKKAVAEATEKVIEDEDKDNIKE